MPTGNSFYQWAPGRYAKQKQEFQRLITELKRLALKKGYSQVQIASEVGVSLMSVKTGGRAFLNGATREYQTTEEVFGGSLNRLPFESF